MITVSRTPLMSYVSSVRRDIQASPKRGTTLENGFRSSASGLSGSQASVVAAKPAELSQQGDWANTEQV